MPKNSKFLSSDTTLAWLGQFDAADQLTAVDLLESMQLVSRDKFNDRLRELILARSRGDGLIGLYAERELNHRRGVPHRLFKESARKVKRAEGSGPQPVRPTKAYDPDVGSEGIVAQLISELCREFPEKFVSHPGPDNIRKRRVRRFMLVTDFIGSGNRAYRYIQAAWLVRSVRSWWSARKTVGMRFEVAAYAATESGQRRVQRHPSLPDVHIVRRCDTLSDYSMWQRGLKLRELCVRYDPLNHDRIESLGYGGTGALIAFAHGAPNNSPRILHTGGRGWIPLFPKRITSGTRETFASASELDDETIRSRLLDMRQTKLAVSPWLSNAKPYARRSLMVLAALSRPPRDSETISRRTGLTILDIEKALITAVAHYWIDDARRLTDQGHAELDNAKYEAPELEPLSEPPEILYYPKSLRAPSKVSS
ncbi:MULTISPECIES: hypothetical protein [unclassified Mesorhizobium]|uniref:phosphoribosyltransferase-like protein n=1 Tax=unclassified Mesorhizobium TaxID=325217 RepID=UPI000FCBAE08|nr:MULTISPECIES: hypothetical protein [unclassified Mesorhizobium]RUZ82646.1 hypothetical protein EN947_17335 [Mesorhizobium sp. M7A.F.Ca.US.003.02.2.1]RUY94732.1 hypothetical protein EN974_23180 [Mesorhizobium sp. M7A.F.Ca.CA.001.12.2.1]RUZ27468.1 hypothetical protein EN949_09620 [Mesorhizobium sp. M7A.F.Ca.US.007.01.2.1]RUZ44975.1 hypothetical protein EN948_21075 [Mesorhizobium sp. M7A.F.Ca.US.003.02.1.1]RUZ66776.1 hypothetical protein EN950_11075 [Mesorhizobium sp. M7A.F.Ca.US.007.01.1.1]